MVLFRFVVQFCLCLLLSLFARFAAGDELPAHCREDLNLARELSRMGPVLGLGASVSHGLLARSASEIIAEQLCLDSDGHVFPWFFPGSDLKATKFYYKKKRSGLVLALDATYHDMKVLEGTRKKIEVLDELVAGLALDCESALYDCSAGGNDAYVKKEDFRPTVILGDVFFENLIDCSQGDPTKLYRAENNQFRPDKLCYEENQLLNRHLKNIAARYPNVHLFPVNHLFTGLVKYPYSIFYDEGTRQTFFSRKQLTWDGWHPYTNPGSFVFANLIIMQINRLVDESKIKGRRIPLRTLSDRYFGPPSGLIVSVPASFPAVTNPQIVGPGGEKIPLRFSLSRQWVERHGVFSIGRSYFRGLAEAWGRLGPRPIVVRAQSFSGKTIVLSKKDQALLAGHHQKGTALKGALLLIGADPNKKSIPRGDTFFLNQIEKDPGILVELPPPAEKGNPVLWEY